MDNVLNRKLIRSVLSDKLRWFSPKLAYIRLQPGTFSPAGHWKDGRSKHCDLLTPSVTTSETAGNGNAGVLVLLKSHRLYLSWLWLRLQMKEKKREAV